MNCHRSKKLDLDAQQCSGVWSTIMYNIEKNLKVVKQKLCVRIVMYENVNVNPYVLVVVLLYLYKDY